MVEQLQMILRRIFEVLSCSLNQPLFEYLYQLVFVNTISERDTQVPLEFLYRTSKLFYWRLS